MTSPLASLRIFPSSRVSVRAISSARWRAMSAARQSTRPRSGPGVFFQALNDAWAASMARWTSAWWRQETQRSVASIRGIDVTDEPLGLRMKPFAVDIRTGLHGYLAR